MSLEIDLARIAVALEEMVKLLKVSQGNPVPAPVKVAKAPKAEPVAPPMATEPEVDPFAQDEAVASEPVVTFESLTDLLKTHAKKLGTKVTIALITKHGADRVTPKMNTIPEANYKACYDEAAADLKKLEGKK